MQEKKRHHACIGVVTLDNICGGVRNANAFLCRSFLLRVKVIGQGRLGRTLHKRGHAEGNIDDGAATVSVQSPLTPPS
jgi:hypothetical protein